MGRIYRTVDMVPVIGLIPHILRNKKKDIYIEPSNRELIVDSLYTLYQYTSYTVAGTGLGILMSYLYFPR